MTRAQMVAEAQRLRALGMIYEEIGQRLGRSRSWAAEACTDPDMSKAHARKQKVFGFCIDCNVRVTNAGSEPGERCRPCEKKHRGTVESRRQQSAWQLASKKRWRWTDGEIFVAIRSIADEAGLANVDDYEAAYAAAPRGSMPSRALIHMRFGLWSDAVVLAGCHVKRGRMGPYSTRLTEEGAALAVSECRADLGKWPTHAEYDRWARRVGAPSASHVRNRWGTWMAAIDAAIAAEQNEEALAA